MVDSITLFYYQNQNTSSAAKLSLLYRPKFENLVLALPLKPCWHQTKTFNSWPNLTLAVLVKFFSIKDCVLVTKVKGNSPMTVILDFPQYFKGSWLKTALYKMRITLRHIAHLSQERFEQFSCNEKY